MLRVHVGRLSVAQGCRLGEELWQRLDAELPLDVRVGGLPLPPAAVGQALLLLTEDHLVSAMNIKLGPALKICAQINTLKRP